MAYELGPCLKMTAEANEAMNGEEYLGRFVKWAGDGLVDLCDALTDRPCGVLLSYGADGDKVQIGVTGVFKVRAGAALATVGTLVKTAADAEAIAATPGTDTTHYIVGHTLEAASGAGSRIACAINCASPARAA